MKKPHIEICLGSSCFARGNEKNLKIIQQFIAANNLTDEVDLILDCSLCKGNCSKGPNITIDSKLYSEMDQVTTERLLQEIFKINDQQD